MSYPTLILVRLRIGMADLPTIYYLQECISVYLSIYPVSRTWSFWFREGALNRRPDALAGAAPTTMIQFSSPTT